MRQTDRRTDGRTPYSFLDAAPRAALTGKHDTLVRRAHQMLNAALAAPRCQQFKLSMRIIGTAGIDHNDY